MVDPTEAFLNAQRLVESMGRLQPGARPVILALRERNPGKLGEAAPLSPGIARHLTEMLRFLVLGTSSSILAVRPRHRRQLLKAACYTIRVAQFPEVAQTLPAEYFGPLYVIEIQSQFGGEIQRPCLDGGGDARPVNQRLIQKGLA